VSPRRFLLIVSAFLFFFVGNRSLLKMRFLLCLLVASLCLLALQSVEGIKLGKAKHGKENEKSVAVANNRISKLMNRVGAKAKTRSRITYNSGGTEDVSISVTNYANFAVDINSPFGICDQVPTGTVALACGQPGESAAFTVGTINSCDADSDDWLVRIYGTNCLTSTPYSPTCVYSDFHSSGDGEQCYWDFEVSNLQGQGVYADTESCTGVSNANAPTNFWVMISLGDFTNDDAGDAASQNVLVTVCDAKTSANCQCPGA